MYSLLEAMGVVISHDDAHMILPALETSLLLTGTDLPIIKQRCISCAPISTLTQSIALAVYTVHVQALTATIARLSACCMRLSVGQALNTAMSELAAQYQYNS